jgi:hypothetical protein
MCSLLINNRFKKGLYVSMVAVYIFCCIFSLSLTTLLIMLVRNVLLLLVVAQMDILIRCRSHFEKLLLSMRTKEITQRDMSDSLDRGKKGKKKRKNPFKLLLFHSFTTLL